MSSAPPSVWSRTGRAELERASTHRSRLPQATLSVQKDSYGIPVAPSRGQYKLRLGAVSGHSRGDKQLKSCSRTDEGEISLAMAHKCARTWLS